MSYDRFTLHMDGIQVDDELTLPNYWIGMRVYDTAAELRAASARHTGEPEGTSDGCFSWPEKPGHNGYIGLMRLHRERLTPEVIAHESVHVGVMVAKVAFNVAELRLNAAKSHQREEAVAYVAGLLAGFLIEKYCLP